MGISQSSSEEPHEWIEPESGQEDFCQQVIICMELFDMQKLMLDNTFLFRTVSQVLVYENGPEK